MKRRDTPPNHRMLLICTNVRPDGSAACGGRGSEELLHWLKDYAKAKGLKKMVRITRTGCLDLCAEGPNIAVEPDRIWYTGVTKEDLRTIAEVHLDPLVDPPARAKNPA